ncbi:MAG: alpha/beta hydrolase, partial [Burkholderiales bacterium]
MPIAKIRGVNIRYQVIGNAGPWLALITGGRRGHDEFVPLAERIAADGYRVLLHDRRNTGASDVLIEGTDSEEIIWTDDLRALFAEVGISKAVVGGSSSGARTSILYYLRHPTTVNALLLMRLTGGAFAAGRLPENYYGQFIRAAREGGMAAVCATEQYQERFVSNASNRPRLMAMDPKRYIEVMSHWQDIFVAGGKLPVMGVTDAELGSIKVPTLIVPGNDQTHSSESAKVGASLIPGAVVHQLPITDQAVPIIPYPEWAHLEPEICRVFV